MRAAGQEEDDSDTERSNGSFDLSRGRPISAKKVDHEEANN